MREEKRVYADGVMIERIRKKRGLSVKELMNQADVKVDSVDDARHGAHMDREILTKIAVIGLKVDLDLVRRDVGDKPYTWDDMVGGANIVATKVFKNFKATGVLTFPGPGGLFANLAVTMLPLGQLVRTKVYTAILIDKQILGPAEQFHEVETDDFKILVPKALTQEHKRIVVIDDTITSGGAMKRLREFFKKKQKQMSVQFACCMCWSGLPHMSNPKVPLPEIIGIQPLAREPVFFMPWEKPCFTYEKGFAADPAPGQHSKRSPGAVVKNSVQ